MKTLKATPLVAAIATAALLTGCGQSASDKYASCAINIAKQDGVTLIGSQNHQMGGVLVAEFGDGDLASVIRQQCGKAPAKYNAPTAVTG